MGHRTTQRAVALGLLIGLGLAGAACQPTGPHPLPPGAKLPAAGAAANNDDAGASPPGSGGATAPNGTGGSAQHMEDAAVTAPADAGMPPLGGDAGVDGGGAPVVPVPPPVAQGCVDVVDPGQHSFICNDLEFITSVPEQCVSEQCGLIIDVHGGTMSADMEDKNTEMRARGREHGYVVIQPNANLGLFDPENDDPIVFGFANTVIDVFHLDRDRIHMMGFSQGGYMTWRFVCAHTDWLASAAPAAAAGEANISLEVGCTFTGDDVPDGEIDLLYMHGHRDALVDYANAEVLRDAVIARYGASQSEVVASGTGYTRTRYSNAAGTSFEFIDHDYASDSAVGLPPLGIAIEGHCYPGSSDLEATLPDQLMPFGCQPPTAFTWSEEVMRFFQKHPKR
jgi:predicted esterase